MNDNLEDDAILRRALDAGVLDDEEVRARVTVPLAEVSVERAELLSRLEAVNQSVHEKRRLVAERVAQLESSMSDSTARARLSVLQDPSFIKESRKTLAVARDLESLKVLVESLWRHFPPNTQSSDKVTTFLAEACNAFTN